MKKKYLILIITLIFSSLSFLNSQTKELVADSLSFKKKDKESVLLNNVKYDASDSIIIDQKNNKITLYNNAKIEYGDIELTSGLIILDYKENIVTAGRIADSNGNLTQFPTFVQGGNVVNPDSIKYNFDNQKALIWNSKSEENGMNILSSYTKKQAEI